MRIPRLLEGVKSRFKSMATPLTVLLDIYESRAPQVRRNQSRPELFVWTDGDCCRRHEANHNSEPLFQCCIEDCRKPFQRSDLLARHMERQWVSQSHQQPQTNRDRHNMPAEASLARSSRSQRSASEASIADSNPSSSGMIPASMGQPQPLRGQAMTQTTGTMSIGSIIEPSMRNDYGHPSRISNDLSHLAVGVGPRTLPAELIYGISAAAESPLYSSDNSCYSPMSDYLKPQANSQSYLPPDAVTQAQTSPLESHYQPQLMTSPLSSASAYPVWEQFDSSMLGGQLDGAYLPTVGTPHLRFVPPVILTDSIAAGSPVPVSFPYMDGYEWQSLRNEFAPTTAMVVGGQGNLLGVDNKFKHYLDSYWQHFHPFFPVLHRSALISTPPPPMLALLMVVIGAQFSSFPESKNITSFWYESCVGFLSTVSKNHTINCC